MLIEEPSKLGNTKNIGIPPLKRNVTGCALPFALLVSKLHQAQPYVDSSFCFVSFLEKIRKLGPISWKSRA